ncbi:unnamed protein product [Onchocerca flexuosa]|uniref:Transmembrane protein n=1 Tax=Onchocerca flexuosa TaxID=387005 RepID=A0A183I0N4_9BILA|nr:unnamed protein product [Onchocerca flexuosa]
MFESANLSRRMDNYDSSGQEAHRGCHKIKSTNGGCTTTGRSACVGVKQAAAVASSIAVAVVAIVVSSKSISSCNSVES